mgnify:CR=1 FL=1
MKKGGACCLFLLLIVIGAFFMFGNSGDKPVENKTITVGGITFDAPVTNNNTTSFTKLDDGSINWAYEDYENNVSVYVDEEMPVNYTSQETYDSIGGYCQMRPVGDKWLVVYADSRDLKDMCYLSAHVD